MCVSRVDPHLESVAHSHFLAPSIISGTQNSGWQAEDSSKVLSCLIPLQGSATSLWTAICLLAVWLGEQPSWTSAFVYSTLYKCTQPSLGRKSPETVLRASPEPDLIPRSEYSAQSVRALARICAICFLTQMLLPLSNYLIFLFSWRCFSITKDTLQF